MADDNIIDDTTDAPRLIRGKDVVRKKGAGLKKDLHSAFDEYYFKKIAGEDIDMCMGGAIYDGLSIEKLRKELEGVVTGICLSIQEPIGLRYFNIVDEENQDWVECKELKKIKDMINNVKNLDKSGKSDKYNNMGRPECRIKGCCQVLVFKGKRYILFNKDYRGSDHIQVAKELLLENYLFEEEFYIVDQVKEQQYSIKLIHSDYPLTNAQEDVQSQYRKRKLLSDSQEDIDRYLKDNNAVEVYEVNYVAKKIK